LPVILNNPRDAPANSGPRFWENVMAKKKRSTTPQERMVAHFAEHSISARNTFHPNLWKKSGREPADMIIVIGRAVLFVNMTASRSYLQELIDHNINQGRARMLEWAAGLSIKGSNRWRSFDIDWSAVDYIALISVVDGPHAGCAHHDISSLDLNPKVRLCATVTAGIMFNLANKVGGARDLLAYCLSLRTAQTLSPEEGVRKLLAQYDAIRGPIEAACRIPKKFGRAILQGKEVNSIDEYINLLTVLRREGNVDSDIFADLSWSEILRSAAFFANSAAQMESHPLGFTNVMRIGEVTKITLVMTSNAKGLNENVGRLLELEKQAGVQAVVFIYLTSFGPVPTMALLPTSEARETEKFLSEL
jgi:hypothetical protein